MYGSPQDNKKNGIPPELRGRFVVPVGRFGVKDAWGGHIFATCWPQALRIKGLTCHDGASSSSIVRRERHVIEVKGKGGQIQFDGQYVTITRKGLLARSIVGKGEKRLHISQIASIQWKPAGAVVNGFIQFGVPGGVERRSKFGNQTQDALKDENSVVFTKQQMPAFEELRKALDVAIAQQHAPQQPTGAQSPSLADELAKLGQLMQQGILTQAEFEQQKARLLGNQ